LNDLQVLIVNPNASYEEPLLGLFGIGNDLRRNIKDVETQFVNFVSAHESEIVLRNFCRLEREWVDATQILNVFRGNQPSKGRHRKVANFFVAVAGIIKSERGHAVILSGDLTAHSNTLQNRVALEGVLV